MSDDKILPPPSSVARAERTDVHFAVGSEQVLKYTKQARKKSAGKIILVPVDFSENSHAALIEGGKFANLMGASLVVLHVVHDPSEMPGYYAKLVKHKHVTRIPEIAAEVFEDFIDAAVSANPELEYLYAAEKLMVKGLPVSRILEVVDLLKPTMVVVGSQGRSKLEQIFLGSKAAQLVQMSPVSITVVKTPKE